MFQQLYVPTPTALSHITTFNQFQQSRSSGAGSGKVKAIKHLVNFQNKTQNSAHVAYHDFTSTLRHFYKGKAWHLIAVVLGVNGE